MLRLKYRARKTGKNVKRQGGGNSTKKHAAAPGMRRQTIKGASHSGSGGMLP